MNIPKNFKYVAKHYNYIPIDVYYDHCDGLYCYFIYQIERDSDGKKIECTVWFDLEDHDMTLLDMLEEVSNKNGEEFGYICLDTCSPILKEWYKEAWMTENDIIAFTEEEWLEDYSLDELADLIGACEEENLVPDYVDFDKNLCKKGTEEEYVFITYLEFPTRFYSEVK